MDRDTVIALAREAAFYTPVMEGELMRFATLVYERGFVDGMSEQTKRSVDKAVNRMAEPEQKGWFTVEELNKWATQLPQPEHEVRNLADYEFKTYKTGGAELEAGFYSTDELRDLVKALDKMNAAAERSMLEKPQPSGSFVLWENTLCNPLSDSRSMAHSAWHDGHASGAKDERKRIVTLLQAQNKHKDRQNFYAYVIKLIEEPA